ncbi:MAG: efflux RND transporter periplasmic adaptor subunit [bacterium]
MRNLTGVLIFKKETSCCLRIVAACALAALTVLSAGCGQVVVKGSGSKDKPVPIRTAVAEEKSSDIIVKAVGTVEPMQTVAIRSQVGGLLSKICFNEGDEVKAGAVLFEIDPRTFQADLKRAEATVVKDEAQLANAERQARRYEELIQKDFVAKSQYDEITTSVEVLKATVKVDKESVESARLQLERSTITAPITGRTGSLMVHAGDLIKAGDVALVSINQIKPILVRFAVPASNLPEIRRRMAEMSLVVRVSASGDPGRQFEGLLCFVDNSVDESTGTILLKARFSNDNSALWPGQFLDVALILRTDAKALAIPSAAVQVGQDGLFVFVVKKDEKEMTVEKRPVTILRSMADTSIVGSGLTVGEALVTDGQVRLIPGSRVEIVKASQGIEKAKKAEKSEAAEKKL